MLSKEELKSRQLRCENCKKKFMPIPSYNRKRRYCSPGCCYAHRKANTKEYQCLHCGAAFRRVQSMVRERMFCSDNCSRKAGRPPKLRRFVCQYCKETSHITRQNKRKIYCSYVCNGLARRTSTRPDSERLSARLETWGRKVRRRDKFRCVVCGSENKLQAHHILSFSTHPHLRYDVSNGKTLCIDCHASEHPEIAPLIKSKLR